MTNIINAVMLNVFSVQRTMFVDMMQNGSGQVPGEPAVSIYIISLGLRVVRI